MISLNDGQSRLEELFAFDASIAAFAAASELYLNGCTTSFPALYTVPFLYMTDCFPLSSKLIWTLAAKPKYNKPAGTPNMTGRVPMSSSVAAFL